MKDDVVTIYKSQYAVKNTSSQRKNTGEEMQGKLHEVQTWTSELVEKAEEGTK